MTALEKLIAAAHLVIDDYEKCESRNQWQASRPLDANDDEEVDDSKAIWLQTQLEQSVREMKEILGEMKK